MGAPHHAEKFLEEHAECLRCGKEGGKPFLMTADDELHCSRCFEDLSPSEFTAWLEDAPLIVECASSVATAEAARVDALYLGGKQTLRCETSRAVA